MGGGNCLPLEWTRKLRALGRTALLHHEATAAEALAVHITTMAAQGRRSTTLRGVVSSVRMAERLEVVPPTVPLHWLLCEAADKLYCPRLATMRGRRQAVLPQTPRTSVGK